jgi:hypothetical protein
VSPQPRVSSTIDAASGGRVALDLSRRWNAQLNNIEIKEADGT